MRAWNGGPTVVESKILDDGHSLSLYLKNKI